MTPGCVHKIGFLAHHLQAVDRLAAWMHAEWFGGRMDWDIARGRRDLLENACGIDAPDITILAMDRQDRPLGMIQIINDDELEGWRHKGPWLASLYVNKEARGGVTGHRLVEYALTHATSLKIEEIYFYSALAGKSFLAGRRTELAGEGICSFTRKKVHVRKIIL